MFDEFLQVLIEDKLALGILVGLAVSYVTTRENIVVNIMRVIRGMPPLTKNGYLKEKEFRIFEKEVKDNMKVLKDDMGEIKEFAAVCKDRQLRKEAPKEMNFDSGCDSCQ